MLIAAYDYWGYYNVCFSGDEIKEPGKNIRGRCCYLLSAVACLYVVMNISILGVVPWREMVHRRVQQQALRGFHLHAAHLRAASGRNGVGPYYVDGVASVFSLCSGIRGCLTRRRWMETISGVRPVHPVHKFPYVSLLALAGVAALFCFLRLADLIAALVVIRILLQFLVQSIGVIVLRITASGHASSVSMWLYPLPALVAAGSFIFILFSRKDFGRRFDTLG